MDKIEKFQLLIDNAKKIVFFGGAGVSTESGIPDFRSVDGLYNQEYDYPPEYILSHTFFNSHTEYFYKFYKNKMLPLDAKPNITHIVLSELEKKGRDITIVTQNIDGLHQLAGSKKVDELHGSIHRNYCFKCGKFYDAKFIKNSTGIPYCECGGIIKPDVVLYEEALDNNTVSHAINSIHDADLLIIAGTSLNVYPAASFIDFYRGKDIVLINKTATQKDSKATLVFYEALGDVMGKIKV